MVQYQYAPLELPCTLGAGIAICTLGVGVVNTVTSFCGFELGAFVWIGLSMRAVLIDDCGFGRGSRLSCRNDGVTLSLGGAVVASNVTRVRRF